MKQKIKKNLNKSSASAKHRTLHGVVVSDKMQKTVVVKVSRLKLNKKYKRRYQQSKRYKAHDPQEKFKVGDNVFIIESLLLSKDKRWVVMYGAELQTKSTKEKVKSISKI